MSPAGGPSPFADHFSSVSQAYAQFRPGYPPALFDWLADIAPDRRLAWDCGTGTGLAALALADRFDRVIATDPSAAQLAAAPRRDNITYRLRREADSGITGASVALVTAAQAAHWFDLEAFHREVRRVLVPGGIVAIWCYGLMEIDSVVDGMLHHFEHEVVGPWWPPERCHVDARYETLSFPWERLRVPEFAMEARLGRAALLGYLGSWSAVARYRKATDDDPLPVLDAELSRVWPAEEVRLVRWPLTVLAGRAASIDESRAHGR